MRGCDTSASGADIEGLGELDELCAGHIDTAQKHGNLQPEARGTALNGIQTRTLPVNLRFQGAPVVPPTQYGSLAASMP